MTSPEYALRSTTVLATKVNTPSIVEPQGSTVLLKVEDDIFLITAAHVLNEKTWPILLIPITDKKMAHIKGRLLTTQFGDQEAGLMDIAVLKLDRALNSFLQETYRVNHPSDVLLGYTPNEQDNLLFAGYPATRLEKHSHKSFSSNPFKFVTYSKPLSFYRKNNLNPGCFILSEYRKRVMNSDKEKSFAPHLYGTSGSGLWKDNSPDKTPKLIGINSEHDKNKSYILSVKIDVAVHIIKDYFGKSSIPEPQVTCDIGTVAEIILPF